MLLLADETLAERRRVTAKGGPLAPLYDSLAVELEPLLTRGWHVPTQKALLSRAGGRCERDGAMLEFDPWSPSLHRCPTCGNEYRGELHDRWWVMSYQLWLAERAVHAALFHTLRGEQRHATLARDILRALAERYLEYPNRDNVLGPTRPFFSTYLESIWLLQICVAADLLEAAGDVATAEIVRDRIVEPSRTLIAVYDEGKSNRQVWNNAALLASSALLDDDAAFDARLHGASGLDAHLSGALLGDGTWYEGENYHQFALRGLWYGVTLAERRGHSIDAALQRRFERAFETPYLTALPDFTMPSRKDSQYAVSLRQWRMAELAELGYTRSRSSALAGALARSYEPGHTRRDTGRARSTADVERNGPSGALTRADLGWRALLYAVPEPTSAATSAPKSALLEQQGIAVFRRADAYVALDYGEYGGGHGHPDRLNLVLAHGDTRWLDDLGTGSYVERSLHWYRSTLAHNAPLVNGRSQPERNGTLRAWDERGALGWIVARFDVPDDGAEIERAVVAAPDYLVDELTWTADRVVQLDLPWHLEASATHASFQPLKLKGGTGLEDGFDAVRETYATQLVAQRPLVLEGLKGERRLSATLISDASAMLYLGTAPGQPASESRHFYVIRSDGKAGRLRAVLSWSDTPPVVSVLDDTLVVAHGGETHVHKRDHAGWHVELVAGGARSSIDLTGFRHATPPDQQTETVREPAARFGVVRRAVPRGWWDDIRAAGHGGVVVQMGERHYRRSDVSWRDAGSPSASIHWVADDKSLVMFARVAAGDRRFVSADAVNDLDNEHADTMGAGIQLYVRSPSFGQSGAWMLVPESGDRVRVRDIEEWGFGTPNARWRQTDDGYEIRADIPIPNGDQQLEVDVLVNETTADRVRRRGQLVMSGAHGEFVYLRGDRHAAARLVPLRVGA